MQQILRTGIAAVTLLLFSACATVPAKIVSLPLPTQTAALPALMNSPPPIPASEEPQPPTLRPTEEAAISPSTVSAEELIMVPATEEMPALSTAAAAPAYHQSFASYYAKRFNGRRTASGERYDPELMTAATRDFPLQSWLKVINPANGREVIVRVNDRTGKRKTPLIDLSRAAAKQLDFLEKGKIRVHVFPVSPPL